jgi:hypothetical protein
MCYYLDFKGIRNRLDELKYLEGAIDYCVTLVYHSINGTAGFCISVLVKAVSEKSLGIRGNICRQPK